MGKHFLWAGTVLLSAAILGNFVFARAPGDHVNDVEALNLMRPCAPKIGDSALTLAATTGADADSGALTDGTVYMMTCDTDAWVRWGAAAVTAAADDWFFSSNDVLFFRTGGSQDLLHVSALSVTADGDCRLIECL